MSGGLERLTQDSTHELLAFLARRPVENVYLAWLLERGVAERSTGSVVLWRDGTRAIRAACFVGPQTLTSWWDACDPGMLDALATVVARAAPRTIVGPQATLEPIWARARAELEKRPATVRAAQPLYALERTTLRGSRFDATVGRATRADLDALLPHAAAMITGETGIDPRPNGDFRGRSARIVDAGWWWLYRVRGEIAFTCHIGATGGTTAAIQGVWTPPAMRGRGHATRALGAICDRLLDEHRTLSLHVNAFNAPAIALYERVGFARAGTFATVLLAR